ncbi:MAG TPA: ATP-binding protein [Candidatus Sumerlaeota bacterium]|nr:ATP-binding protein [Candidatus Sumerlaeota bacterium]
MAQLLHITLQNDLSEVERLNDEVSAFIVSRGLDAETVFKVNLALEEVVTNVMNYAYGRDVRKELDVLISHEPGELTIEVVDSGPPFNPLERPEPDLTLPIEKRPIGGLGIHLVRSIMNGLDYHRTHDKNHLIMKKQV